ncbi:MAG: hypothetical protein MUF54_03575, partial [Polyangiaceae bacterium]|nr:hypothetical protein [Polyangiaceae bacterium]
PARMTRAQLRAGWVGAWLQMYSVRSMAKRFDPGADRSWIQNLGYWPLNLVMRELAVRKIAGGARSWRQTRRIRMPFGL